MAEGNGNGNGNGKNGGLPAMLLKAWQGLQPSDFIKAGGWTLIAFLLWVQMQVNFEHASEERRTYIDQAERERLAHERWLASIQENTNQRFEEWIKRVDSSERLHLRSADALEKAVEQMGGEHRAILKVAQEQVDTMKRIEKKLPMPDGGQW